MSAALRGLLDAAEASFALHVPGGPARRSTAAIFDSLRAAPLPAPAAGARLPACAHLADACVPERMPEGPLRALAHAFLTLEPQLSWYKRTGDTTGANAAYHGGHANAMIAGPRGLLRQNTAWLGVSLLAPGVRYPDHDHPPEETYLVLSPGAFFQAGRGWFTPGVGGSFYNPPGILHAMRADRVPLFAFWALRAA